MQGLQTLTTLERRKQDAEQAALFGQVQVSVEAALGAALPAALSAVLPALLPAVVDAAVDATLNASTDASMAGSMTSQEVLIAPDDLMNFGAEVVVLLRGTNA